MSNELIKVITTDNGINVIESREVARMTGKRHDNLLRDIDGYIKILDQSSNLSSANFFIESAYTNNNNQSYKCYLLTKQGCEMVANKMTGEKGILFTATYVQAFNEMEKKLQTPATYLEALKALVAAEEEKLKLQEANKTLAIENDLLSKQEYEWADAELINALVRAYGHSINDYSKAWKEFKKNLLYSYSININSRITNYLNTSGKKTKPKTLSMLKTPEEISSGVSTAISMCKENNIDISEILNHYNEQRKAV